ncbi:hypothetical protein BU26DRAFT_485985 [Trematosphaeria pertusa]|uniref:Fungal N-terminal domain-containing protein n=1 Tax=Trematosphaeria pertusa TaxID=390896 RepID=A0A6A6IE88_9PLEO|nr:uncharacterized protein BU26DRAFT_485985 [Trematosphaeria pertusa]KAF2248378.1 hypothetical protein BU26DRAFT_485985 [Trematosphaeria pertusa]
MADPLTAFGAAAGAVQIADVALRASGEAYGFLAAVKDAGKDVQALRDTLCGVESNIRSLRNYVSKFSKSKNAREEFEVLPEAITGTLMRFHDDMVYLKSVLPRKPSPTLAQKVRWAYNRHRVASAIKRLNDRKTDLNIALAITGR